MKWNDLKRGYADRITKLAKISPGELLGVDPQASPEEIREAYLRLVKAYHPDLSDSFMVRHNQEMLKLINAAYEKLRAGG